MDKMEGREVAVVRQQATKALNAANECAISTKEDFEKAADILSRIKQVGRMVKERKEAITRPLMESLNSVRDLFKPIEQSHADAERIIKGKMLAWQAEQEKEQEKEKARLAERVDKGTMKASTAIEKIGAMEEVPTTARGKFGQATTRTIRRAVTDEQKAIQKAQEAVQGSGMTLEDIRDALARETAKARLASKLPREYLMPDTALINEAVLKRGATIPGVEVVEEKVIAAR